MAMRTTSSQRSAYVPSDRVDVLARTLWGEARGEGIRGMEAVACVVLNRAANPRWWGRDIISVCMAPWQFSAWNPDDANRSKMISVNSSDRHFALAQGIARRAVNGDISDNTNGADHYHAQTITPVWARNKKPVAHIGRHKFYRLELRR